MSRVQIDTDPRHVASLIFQVWTQEDVSQTELEELWALHRFYQHSGCDGGAAPDPTCYDLDLPQGSSCARAVARLLESVDAKEEINQ